MTSLDRTAGPPEDPRSHRLRWAAILTAVASMTGVVLLSLMRMTEAAAAVGTIGTTAVTIAGVHLAKSGRP